MKRIVMMIFLAGPAYISQAQESPVKTAAEIAY